MGEITSTALIELALDLTHDLTASDRFARLLSRVRAAIACDAVVLLSIQGDHLKPLAQQGLMSDMLGRRFAIAQHPRFAEICHAQIPVRFSETCPLPDPYDGMLLAREGNLPVHACMGLPLLFNDELMGVLTLDSMTPGVFDGITQRTLTVISALSAAALKTAMRLEQLEYNSQHIQEVVTELTHEALNKDGGELVGNSAAMQKLKREIDLVAVSDFTVLIEGETGVGKELVARTLHQHSLRRSAPLVYVNCAAIPENLVESELFGHVKGAFTGADKNRAGKFSLANRGTIFLDEIGELPLSAQSKLLRVLQNQEIQPVGQDSVETVDVRVLAATNRELQHEVSAGRFRADLYHRLSVYPLSVPALRERDGDTTLLAGYFAEQLRRKLGLQQLILEADTLSQLNRYDWPGNVRELEHVISRAALRAKSQSRSAIVSLASHHLEHLDILSKQNDVTLKSQSVDSEIVGLSEGSLKQRTQWFQRQLIGQVLEASSGNWAAAARTLKVDRSNLIRTAKRIGIRVDKQVLIESAPDSNESKNEC